MDIQLDSYDNDNICKSPTPATWFTATITWIWTVNILEKRKYLFRYLIKYQFSFRYDALGRVGWSIALCYIIFACINNSGGIVNWFLSHPLWQPISRISYAIYLLHFFVMASILAPIKTPSYFSELNIVWFIIFFISKLIYSHLDHQHSRNIFV